MTKAVATLCLLFAATSTLYAQDNIVYPEAAMARIMDVTRAPFNADNTGVIDATAAIQKALDSAARGPGLNLIYLPNGTYKVSNQLSWGGTQKRDMLQGQSKTGTIIKLVNNAPGYSDPALPKPVIWTGVKPAQRFSNAIRNLTVNTGSGNPGATGIQFIANNQGGMFDVLIKSDDGQGAYGLDLGYTDEQGPCLIKGIHVTGFNVGIRTKHAVDGVVMSDILVENQLQYGVLNDGQCLSVEDLRTKGSVPGLVNNAPGVVALINATFEGTGAASGIAAITNNHGFFGRNITTTGFQRAINNTKGGSASNAAYLDEFVSHEVQSLFTSPKKSLNLPVKKAPAVTWGPLSEWVNVGDFPSENLTLPSGKVVPDWTNAIQQAIDSGKETVYFGTGGQFFGTIYLRGNVKRLIGLDTWMGNENGATGSIVVQDGTAPVVVLENFVNQYNQFAIRHESTRQLVLRSMFCSLITTPTSGDVFIEDVYNNYLYVAPGASVYARQIDNESNVKIVNEGTFWALGVKSERDAPFITTKSGAQTEIIGGFIYANKDTNPEKVMFVNEEGSRFSATVGEWVIRNQPFNPVRETREGVTKVMRAGEAPARGSGSMLPLYTAYRAPASAPPAAPSTLTGSAVRYDVIRMNWTDNSANEDGFVIERKTGSGVFAPVMLTYANEVSFRDTLLSPSTAYSYRVRAVNAAGRSNYSNTITITTLQAPATPAAPTNLTATLSGATIELSWTDNSSTENGFKLERKKTADTVFTQIAILPANTTRYTDAGLPASTGYQYRLRSYLEISHSAYSNTASATTAATTELKIHWKLDEVSGKLAGDASGRVNNGNLIGGFEFGTNTITGVQNRGLFFDGLDDKVQNVNNGVWFVPGYPFTISGWVKATGQGTVVFLGDKDRNDKYYLLSIGSGGEAVLEVRTSTTIMRTATGTNVRDDQWHLLTGVMESVNSHKLYVDGVYAGAVTDSIPFHKYMTRFTIGAKDGQSASARLRGSADDARLYTRALSASEVSALYNAESIPAGLPTGSVTSPANNATFTSPASIVINASASDPGGSVQKVEFFQRSTKLGEDTSAPYSFTWSGVGAGSYNLLVKVTDNAGNSTVSAPVVVSVTQGTNAPPSVTITEPSDGQSFAAPASVVISATATDSDGTIANVQFYNGDVLLGSDNSAPYSFAWNGVAAGTYTLTARATDNGGAVTTSSAVAIEVNRACGDINLALGRPAVASTYGSAGTHPKFAVDGNATTRWLSARGNVQWVYVDLGTVQPVSCIRLNWAEHYGVAYKLQTSNDKTTWTDIYNTTSGQGGSVLITDLAASGRYVRMYGTQQGPTAMGYSLWEFEIYGADASDAGRSRSTTPDWESEISQDAALHLFPNPATDEVVVESAEDVSAATVRMFDSSGAAVPVRENGRNTHSIRINVSQSPAGLYLIVLETPGAVQRSKVIIRR